MTKSNNTKHALLMSVLSMMLCIAMLAGSTFAWFTDAITSGKNRIVAGNLDVELYYNNASTDDWTDASEASVAEPNFFVDKDGGNIKWEPGVMAVTQFKVANVGTLALKYALATLKADFNSLLEVDAETKTEKYHDLSEVIKFAVIENDKYTEGTTTREDILALNPKFDDFTSFTAQGELYPKDNKDKKDSEKIFTVVAYWKPSDNDNLWNANNSKPIYDADGNKDKNAEELYINIEINLTATQTPYEKDSFDENYDAYALLDSVPVATAEELAAAIAKGNNVVVNQDIQLPEQLEISGDVTIIGNGATITAPTGGTRIINSTANEEKVTITLAKLNLIADNAERCISFYDNKGGTDLVLDQCTATANMYALNVANKNPNVNITVKNSKVIGWCAFQTWSEGTKVTFENCTLVGNNIFTYNKEGWNNFATIVINNDGSNIAQNAELTFTKCHIEANQMTGNKQYLISVRAPGAKVTFNGCTFFADGNEILGDDLDSYIQVYADAIDLELTINGELIPIE